METTQKQISDLHISIDNLVSELASSLSAFVSAAKAPEANQDQTHFPVQGIVPSPQAAS